LDYYNPADSNTDPVPFGKAWKNGGGKIGLNYKPNRDTLIYASVSRGFKGGTFNFVPGQDLTGFIAPLGRANFQAGVRPEKLTTYEIGAKLEFMDRAVALNVALFRNEYKDQQQIVFKDGGPVLVNAASSRANGAELEVNVAPGNGLTIQGGLSVLDGKYKKYIDPSGFDYSGGKLVQASDVTANATVQQAFEIGSGELTLQGSVKYFSSYYATVPYVPLDKIPGQTLFDARIAYAFGADRNFSIAAFGRNLSNERYCATTGEIPWGLGQCAPNEPRTYGVQVRASF
jgi:iron complex outermembrane receptor protein